MHYNVENRIRMCWKIESAKKKNEKEKRAFTKGVNVVCLLCVPQSYTLVTVIEDATLHTLKLAIIALLN